MKQSSIVAFGAVILSVVTAGAVLHHRAPYHHGADKSLLASLNGTDGAGLRDIQFNTSDKPTHATDDANVARLTALVLAQNHYLHKPIDDAISAKLFDRYLDVWDPNHIYFLQSDVKEFTGWRSKLGAMLERGETSPANKIYARFIERFDAQVDYVNKALKTETFTFTGNDTYVFDRKTLPRPKDMAEAKQLWHDRLRYEYLQEKLNKAKPEDIVKTITHRYARFSHTLHEEDADDVFETYVNALTHVYDPHSDYFGKSALQQFSIQMRLSLVGIGALLAPSDDGYTRIDQLIAGGPAIKSNKLKVGDRIVAVGQGVKPSVDVINMKVDKVVDLIRGPKGTPVHLTIIPVDAADPSVRKSVTLVRDEVHLEESEAKAKLIETPTELGKSVRLGIIDLPSFYSDMDSESQGHKSTTADVTRLVNKLKAEKVDGIVLDLRHNGGGSLDEAIKLTGLFIKNGPVVQVKDSSGEIQVDDDPDSAILYDGPLIILTSKMSASASEILTGALQDYGRAVVVGDTSTFGKGSVQAMIQLGPILKRSGITLAGDPGALKLTIQKFYRASGSSTQLKGVIPDIVLPSLSSVVDVGEKTLDNPLPWDTIPSAKYDKMNLVQPYLAELQKRSTVRIATDKDFSYLKDEIAMLKKTLTQKSVSMNEQERQKEKQEAITFRNARTKELQSRAPSLEKIYLLTLKNVDQPGLPAPMSTTDKKQETAATGTTGGDDLETGTAADKTPDIDITLEETKHILEDYIALWPK